MIAARRSNGSGFAVTIELPQALAALPEAPRDLVQVRAVDVGSNGILRKLAAKAEASGLTEPRDVKALFKTGFVMGLMGALATGLLGAPLEESAIVAGMLFALPTATPTIMLALRSLSRIAAIERRPGATTWAQRIAARTNCVGPLAWLQLTASMGAATAVSAMQVALWSGLTGDAVMDVGFWTLGSIAGVGVTAFMADRGVRFAARMSSEGETGTQLRLGA